MKKLILTTLIFLLALTAGAQGIAFQDFFDKYEGRDGYTTMNFTGALMRMLGGEGDGFKGIESVQMVLVEKPDKAFQKDALSITSREGFAKLMDFNSGEEKFQIWHKQKGKGRGAEKDRSEYIMLAIDPDDAVVIYVQGNIDITNLSKLTDLGKGK